MNTRDALVSVLGAILFAGALVGCQFGTGNDVVVPPTPVVLPSGVGGVQLSDAEVAALAPALTQQASEWRRLREEHSSLIESLPPSPVPTPTLSPREKQLKLGARLAAHGGGLPPAEDVLDDWFDPTKGLVFARPSGGDWTPRAVREHHGYRALVYFNGYPSDVPNFHDGSLQRHLARELAFGAWDVLPMLGEPTPVLVDIIEGSLGWELRNATAPVVNVWSDFVLVRDGEEHNLVIGGVMRMGVMSRGEGDARMDYLVVGDWVGSVVVERVQ